MKKLTALLLFFCLSVSVTEARIVRVVIEKAETYANGRVFGAAGPYQRLIGRAFGEVNPADSHNTIIQDIALAPRNARGMVEYEMEFILLKPVDVNKSNHLLFYNVPNRGNAFPADTTLLKRGYIYLWGGWQGDIYGDNKLKIKVPVATENGKEIIGRLHTEFIVSENEPTQNLSAGAFSAQFHTPYETVSSDNKTATLTRRIHAADEPEVVPYTDWAFADCSKEAFPGQPSTTRISVKGGFDPNYIYELNYTAKNPLVLGLGFAATRDIVAFMRHSESADNPLANQVKAAIGVGVSQCGNFLRSFLHLGFNADEDNQPVFEGLNVHIGARRITLNVRFGRPGGGGMQHEEVVFPGNEAPFTWSKTYDPLSGTDGGILDACQKQGFMPKIMHTLSSTEYWQSRMSLRTTDVYGTKDLEIPDNVRIYLFSGTQHTPAFNSNINKLTGFMANPNSYLDSWRALQVALEQWVLDGTLPPPGIYPKLKNNTLAKGAEIGWQPVAHIPFRGLLNEMYVRDFGPQFDEKMMSGVLAETPVSKKDKRYVVLVPKVNADNNELGGLETLTHQVPLGTYTGWSLRKAGYGEGDLAVLEGMYIPFAKTKAERIAAGDSRLSLEERYPNHTDYVNKVKAAAAGLVKQRLILPEDAEREIKKAEQLTIFNY
ncbi:alpha/beta hydrolase domain-containing protein [Emticicia fluvialis]|uniref:alpha/beta hydrolase domain-containing protein n=1 Tax=Emticicia fluvialis TaxID=2974474 RepID=UPI002165552C|nr:alpha/beta hydrolase domain-containing protein [Emticicia fluvialis]